MADYLCPPISDVGPNGYTPTPAGAHYAQVDEDPNDGDSTFLITATGTREVWALDVSAIPDGYQIISVKIRSVQKGTTAGSNTYHTGFVIEGVDYFGQTNTVGAQLTYIADSTVMLDDPSGVGAWTKASLARAFMVHEQLTQAIGLPRPRLTECVVIATAIPMADRPTATDAAVVGSAAASGGAASGTPQALRPAAQAVAVVGSSVPAAVAMGAAAAAAVASAFVTALSRTAPAATSGKPYAIPTSVAPTVSAASMNPIAVPAAYTPPMGEDR